MEWLEQARCRTTDPDLWHGLDSTVIGESDNRRMEKKAKKECGLCPVRMECMDLAATYEAGAAISSMWGIWGGMDRYERWCADPSIDDEERAARVAASRRRKPASVDPGEAKALLSSMSLRAAAHAMGRAHSTVARAARRAS
jgi:hypothetical protein